MRYDNDGKINWASQPELQTSFVSDTYFLPFLAHWEVTKSNNKQTTQVQQLLIGDAVDNEAVQTKPWLSEETNSGLFKNYIWISLYFVNLVCVLTEMGVMNPLLIKILSPQGFKGIGHSISFFFSETVGVNFYSRILEREGEQKWVFALCDWIFAAPVLLSRMVDWMNSTPSFSRAVLALWEARKCSVGAAGRHLIFSLHSFMAGGSGQLMSTVPFSNTSARVTFNHRWLREGLQSGEVVPLLMSGRYKYSFYWRCCCWALLITETCYI